MADGPSSPPRVALVHDFLLDMRGAERVFSVMCDTFPDADVFTAVYDEEGTLGHFADRHPRTSPLQRLRPTDRTFRAYLPLYPALIEGLDLSAYDLVVSSSSAWAHGVRPRAGAVHLCYCHNPFRYAWSARTETLEAMPFPLRPALRAVLARWRAWDVRAAKRVDRYVANSAVTRSRIRDAYGRDASVLHPPVATQRFSGRVGDVPVGDRYVVLTALMRHKHVDVAVRAFTAMGQPLTVIGKGPDRRRLEALAGPTIEFVGRATDAEVERLLLGARALVVTAAEEFGIAGVEAQAAGRPVIALRAGGLPDAIVEGVTGVLYDEPEPAALEAAVRSFDALGADPRACVANAERFSEQRFRDGLLAEVELALAASRSSVTRAAERDRARTAGARGLVAR